MPRPLSTSLLRIDVRRVARVKSSNTRQTLSMCMWMGKPSSTSTQVFGFEEMEPMYAGGGERVHVHVRVQSKRDAGSAQGLEAVEERGLENGVESRAMARAEGGVST